MINDYATLPSDAELIQFATDEQFLLFCDEDEFLDIARAVLQRYSAATPHDTQHLSYAVPKTSD